MTTLNGLVEKLEHAMGLLESLLAYLPGTDPRVAAARAVFTQLQDAFAIQDIRRQLAEVEAEASARAQVIADEWPAEDTKR